MRIKGATAKAGCLVFNSTFSTNRLYHATGNLYHEWASSDPITWQVPTT